MTNIKSQTNIKQKNIGIITTSSIHIFHQNKYWLFILSLIYLTNSCNASTHICNGNPNTCNTNPIDCTPGEPCIIKCTNSSVCFQKKINCPIDQPCEVHCTNHLATAQSESVTFY
eukprot:426853_1